MGEFHTHTRALNIMKPIIFVIQMFFFLFSAIEASEYPQRKEFPLFKVEESGLIDDSVINDIFINSKISQYSGAHKTCEEIEGRVCVHFTECNDLGFFDQDLVTTNMFDVRFGSDASHHLCPEKTEVCCKSRPECPQFWEEWEGHCYLFSPQDSWYTWSRAQAACRANNSSSDLPSVTSEREEMFIRNNTLGSTFWLGGYRNYAAPYKTPSSWRWSDGAAMNHTAWAPGQPNNFWWGERCIRSVNTKLGSETGTWDDHKCWLKSANSLVCKMAVSNN